MAINFLKHVGMIVPLSKYSLSADVLSLPVANN